MIDKQSLIDRVVAYEKKHKPNTGYSEKAIREVCKADLPAGTNLIVQFVQQFTGKEEITDLVHWDKDEFRLPYSNTYRYSLDGSVDCSSFWWIIYNIFWGMNIGTTSEKMYFALKDKKISWEQRRPLDIILYNFKADQGRHASHVAGYIGNNKIAHTTSPKNPFRIQDDSYASGNRVGVYRILTDAQYNDIIVGEQKPIANPKYIYKGATYTNLRDKASVSGKKIGRINHDDVVEYLGSKDGWWNVRLGKLTGYCANTHLFKLYK